jgi:hypothetical protein
MGERGSGTRAGSPAEFRKVLAEEIEKWAKVVTASGTKPE